MNINKVLTKDYENMSNWALYENEPKTNPTCRGVASGKAGFQRQKYAAVLND